MLLQLQNGKQVDLKDRRVWLIFWALSVALSIPLTLIADNLVGDIPLAMVLPLAIGTFVAFVGLGPYIISAAKKFSARPS